MRVRKGSSLHAFHDDFATILDENPKALATVIVARLQPLGGTGGITVLKEKVAGFPPILWPVKFCHRASYLPGEIAQLDWRHTGAQISVRPGMSRTASGLVASLPLPATHAAVFTFGRMTPESCAAVLGCFVRLGSVPGKMVSDNRGCIVKSRRGGPPHLPNEVAARVGQLLVRPAVPRPSFHEGKGQDERTVGCLETSFLPLRRFSSLEDLQHQHDHWAETVAYECLRRRVRAKVKDTLDVERGFLQTLPAELPPDVSSHLEAPAVGRLRSSDVAVSTPGLSM
jgi:hypothetical protein